MLVLRICLCLSIFLFTRTLTLVVVDSSSFKIEEFLHKMAISLKNCPVEQKNHSSLIRWHDLPFSGDHRLRLLDILSVHLCNSVSLPQSKTRLQKRLSPNAGALSPSPSPSPSRWLKDRVSLLYPSLEGASLNQSLVQSTTREIDLRREGWIEKQSRKLAHKRKSPSSSYDLPYNAQK